MQLPDKLSPPCCEPARAPGGACGGESSVDTAGLESFAHQQIHRVNTQIYLKIHAPHPILQHILLIIFKAAYASIQGKYDTSRYVYRDLVLGPDPPCPRLDPFVL